MKREVKSEKRKMGKYLFLAIVALLIALAYFIIKPFVIPLISAFILAYLTKPLYDKLGKFLNKHLSAAICVFLIILIIIVPLSLLITGAIQQASSSLGKNQFSELLSKVSSYNLIEKTGINLEKLKTDGLSFLISILTSTLEKIPMMLLSGIITLWGVYYILINWNSISSKVKAYIPFDNKEKIAAEINNATSSIVHGSLTLALIELIIASIGFYILGIPSAFLLAAIIAIIFLIPPLGAALVWVPTAAFYFFINQYSTAIGVIVIGLILAIFVETYLQGKMIEKKTHINPLIRLIGVIGGVSIFGIFGFIIGPLILVYAIKIIQGGIKK